MATKMKKYLPPRPVFRPGVRTVGIDPSLTATGIATFTDAQGWRVGRVHTEPSGPAQSATIGRIRTIRDGVVELLGGFRSDDIVVIEGFMMMQGSSRGAIIYNWYKLVEAIVEAGIEPIVVAPATRAVYATGGGNGGKDRVMSQLYRRFPESGADTNDEADAVFLAAIGRHLAGHSIEPLPLPNTHLSVDKHFQPLPAQELALAR